MNFNSIELYTNMDENGFGLMQLRLDFDLSSQSYAGKVGTLQSNGTQHNMQIDCATVHILCDATRWSPYAGQFRREREREKNAVFSSNSVVVAMSHHLVDE